jgi:ATPase subunit of ABC transporter with duplicated ATPase domains
MISLNGLGMAHGARTLFRDGSSQLSAGSRYGIVGANGSGKSTLLKIIAGEVTPTEGSVSYPRRARVGVLRQDHFRYERTPILDVVMMGDEELWSALQEKERLLQAEGEFDVERFGELEEVIQRRDGYSMEARAAEILAGLNIPTEAHRQPLSTLSGGFKLRVLLGQTLAASPEILLLDEPTNHLDILSIRWLESYLASSKACVVVVSHDHRFLDNVCTHIVDVDYERLTMYRGNYSGFEVQKREERERKEAEIKLREKQIADHEATIERFRAKPTKARQSRSMAKLVERIVIEELPRSSRRYPKFEFKARRPSGKDVLSLDGIGKAYGGRTVLEDVSPKFRRGERVAIIGPNGIGKSTLIKIAVGEVAPDSGEVEWGYEAHPGYFSQDHSELADDSDRTVESWLWDACAGEQIGFVRGKLAQVLFEKDEVSKKLANLSGGEAARLVFARLSVFQPTVLVLDEPTNHLDLEGIEALVEGLRRYDGTILFVSHDRWFVSKLATRIVEIEPEGIEDFPGTYEEYLAHCGDDHLDVEAVAAKAREEKRRAKQKRRESAR